MEVAQVVRRCHRGLLGIQPLVEPAVHAQAVPPGGGGHELPEPLGSGAGDGHGVKAALDHGREGQFLRQPLLLEDLQDHGQVPAGSREPALHDCVPVARLELVQEVTDALIRLDSVI